MGTMENLVKIILNSLDLDVDGIKAEVTTRISAFETNVSVLTTALSALQYDVAHNRAMLEAICAKLDIPTTAKMELINHVGTNDIQ